MAYELHRIAEVNGQYRITIPKRLVRKFGWEKGDLVLIEEVSKDKVVIELTAKGVRFESGISKRKNGADRPAGKSSKVGG